MRDAPKRTEVQVLKTIDPLLGPKLLGILRSMGHGDEIAIVDANFPAESCARRIVRMDGVSAIAMLKAVVSVLPLDQFVDEAAFSMEVVDDPAAVPDIVREFREIIQAEDPHAGFGALERFAFYDRSRAAFAAVVTGERRLYGNLILKKGVLYP